MQRRWLFVVILAMLMAGQANAVGDWKSALARRAVGKAAQAGIEEAVEDVVKDVGFDAALDAARYKVGEAARREVLGANAGEALEAAMTAADVASRLDTAADVADAARKINKVRKVIRRFK